MSARKEVHVSAVKSVRAGRHVALGVSVPIPAQVCATTIANAAAMGLYVVNVMSATSAVTVYAVRRKVVTASSVPYAMSVINAVIADAAIIPHVMAFFAKTVEDAVKVVP